MSGYNDRYLSVVVCKGEMTSLDMGTFADSRASMGKFCEKSHYRSLNMGIF